MLRKRSCPAVSQICIWEVQRMQTGEEVNDHDHTSRRPQASSRVRTPNLVAEAVVHASLEAKVHADGADVSLHEHAIDIALDEAGVRDWEVSDAYAECLRAGCDTGPQPNPTPRPPAEPGLAAARVANNNRLQQVVCARLHEGKVRVVKVGISNQCSGGLSVARCA